MPNELNTWMEWLEHQPQLLTFSATLALILAAWLSNWIVKRILVRAIYRVVGATAVGRHGQIKESGIIKRLSNIVPALVLSSGAGAEVRSVTGITVFAGTLGVTLFGLFLTPVFYVALRKLANRPLVSHAPAVTHG